jgi:hypothetical protein
MRPLVALTLLAAVGCTDIPDTDYLDTASEAQTERVTKVFYIKNPTSTANPGAESYKVRLTASCTSGYVTSVGLFDSSPVFMEFFSVPRSSDGKYYVKFGSCKNYTTQEVWVECSGSGPKLSYWYYDC